MAPKKKATKKKKMGAPTKWNNDLVPILERLYERGFSDSEVAETLRITEQTLNNWKKKYPDIFESLKDWKKKADDKIVKALYERALGYEHPEEKANPDDPHLCCQFEILAVSMNRVIPNRHLVVIRASVFGEDNVKTA